MILLLGFKHLLPLCYHYQNDSEITAHSLCLANISKDWSVDNMNKTERKGYVYDFSFDYNAIEVANMLDIHKFLIKKNEIV